MSHFHCEHCGTLLIDTPRGYVTGCEHYPADVGRSVYVNELDPNAAHWLSCLPLKFDVVDERSIKDVAGNDVIGFTQCHFFAGIGGWPLALEMAGWPDDAPVWTGSCPCQPFSSAGKRKGTADERHLWPEFRRLIEECRPATIFGEQVASADGRDWLNTVRTDLEALGYEVGAADLCAAGVGAPHIRQRLFWVATPMAGSPGDRKLQPRREHRQFQKDSLVANRMGHAEGDGREQRRTEPDGRNASCPGVRLGDANGSGGISRNTTATSARYRSAAVATNWTDVDFVRCRDGKARPVKPGVRLLAHGVPGRVAQLRGLGNAIVPQVAAEFIGAVMDVIF